MMKTCCRRIKQNVCKNWVFYLLLIISLCGIIALATTTGIYIQKSNRLTRQLQEQEGNSPNDSQNDQNYIANSDKILINLFWNKNNAVVQKNIILKILNTTSLDEDISLQPNISWQILPKDYAQTYQDTVLTIYSDRSMYINGNWGSEYSNIAIQVSGELQALNTGVVLNAVHGIDQNSDINTPFRGVEVGKIVDFETGIYIGDGGIKSTQYGIYALGDISGNNTVDSIGVFVGNVDNYMYSISSNNLIIA